MTLAVFTFVMSIGVLFKVTDLLARGVSWRPIVRILLSGMPQALVFSIPISILTSSLLTFGRLSADGEISAMKACGISLWRIAYVPRLLALGLVVVCIYINNELAPRSHFTTRREVRRLGVESPLEMLGEGRFIRDFAGLTIFIGSRKDDKVFNIRIYDIRKQGLNREVRAKSGMIRASDSGEDLLLDLYDVRVDPFFDDRPGAMFCRRWLVTIPDAFKLNEYRKNNADMTYGELLDGVLNASARFPDLDAQDLAKQRMILLVQLNERLVYSFACYAFVMLGIPLGIRAHRKESSVGIAMSLGLMFSFYLFIIAADSLAKRPETCPHLIVWLPVVVSLILGSALLNRAN